MGDAVGTKNIPDSLCPFCQDAQAILENGLAFVRRDGFPASKGHLLVCTKRHVPSFFSATKGELTAIYELISQAQTLIEKEFKPDGYNIGVNIIGSSGADSHALTRARHS